MKLFMKDHQIKHMTIRQTIMKPFIFKRVGGGLNEGCFALLIMMEEIQIKSGPSAHAWARSVDNLRISRADEQAEKETKEGRVRRS